MLTLEELPIEKLNLSIRVSRALRRNGIRTFGHLQTVMRNGNLRDLRFIGIKGSKEINDLVSDILSQSNQHADDTIQSIPDQKDDFSKDDFISQQLENQQADPINDIGIEKIGLSRRVINSLKKWRIQTVGDLLHADGRFLLQIYQIGPKSINEIQESLQKVLSSPASYIETKTVEQDSSMTWAELTEPFLRSEKDSRIYTLISRFGLKIKTLEETAAELGVTRERVRQIQEVVARRFTKHTNTRPLSSLWVLEKAIEILAKKEEELSLKLFRSALIKEGVLGEFSKPIKSQLYENLNPFEILICWLDILRDERFTQFPENFPIEIDDLRKAKTISIKDHRILQNIPRQKIRSLLRKVAFTGGINLREAMKILSVPEGITILELKILNLEEIRDHWYCFKALDKYNNKLPIRLAGLKIFATIDEVNFEEFYDGLRRHAARFYESIAPPDIIRHAIQLFGFKVRDQKVSVALSKVDVLSKSEKCFIDAVKSYDNVASFLEIAEEFFSQKLSLPAVSVVLKRSPVVEKIDVGLYKVRGTEVSWLDIEKAKNRQKKLSHDAEIAYGLDGIIRYQITINSWAYLSGVISTYQLKDLAGEWSLIQNNGQHETVNMDELFLQGLGKTLKELEIKMGDRAEISFNTWNRTIALRKVNYE